MSFNAFPYVASWVALAFVVLGLAAYKLILYMAAYKLILYMLSSREEFTPHIVGKQFQSEQESWPRAPRGESR